MPAGIQRIEPWIARLQQGTDLRRVEGLAEYMGDEIVRVPPQAWVVPEGFNSDGTFPVATGTDRYSVRIVFNSRFDARGEAAAVQIVCVVDSVIARLAGWVPDDEVDGPIRLTGSRPELWDPERANLWWRIDYEVGRLVRPDLSNKVCA